MGMETSTIQNLPPQLKQSGHFLRSWKQVSTYMGLGVRTVQRYEVNLGLPVHRPAGKVRGAVLAFTDEIDAWLKSTPTRSGTIQRSDTSTSKA